MEKPEYRAVIRWSDEDECFLVSLPDFPGQKWYTHGDTYDECVQNAQKVIELLLDTENPQYSLIIQMNSEDIKKVKGKTDWERVRNLTDEEIEQAVANDPDASPIL